MGGLLIALFGLLNTEVFQNYTKNIIVKELKNKLNTDLGIQDLSFKPLNTIELDSVYVLDRDNNEIFIANKISTSVDLFALLQGKLVFTQALLSDFELHLAKQTSDSTLNIQFIIDAFQKKDNTSNGTIHIQLNTINIKEGKFTYDILDKSEILSKFDPNHIEVSNFTAKLALKSLDKDSLNIQIKRLTFDEKSGFKLSNLTGKLISQKKQFSIKNFQLLLPNSNLEFEKLSFIVKDKKELLAQQDDTDTENLFDFKLTKSYIDPSDLKAFIPSLQNLTEKVAVSAELIGSSKKLKMSSLKVDFGNNLSLEANAELTNWIEEDTYLRAEIKKIAFTGEEIEKISNGFSQQKVNILPGVKKLKDIQFKGSIFGYLDKLTASGTLNTDDGIIQTNLSLGFDKKDKTFSSIKGNIYSIDFDLGSILNNKKFQNISFNIDVGLKKDTNNKPVASLNGQVHNFFFNNYTYKDISVIANHKNEVTKLELNILDENIRLNLSSQLNNTNKYVPKLDIDLKLYNLELNKTNLYTKWNNTNLALNLNAHLEGNNINEVTGKVTIDSISFYRDTKELFINNITLNSQQINKETRAIVLTSDLVDARIQGKYKFNSLMYDLKHILSEYLPALTMQNKRKSNSQNIFDAYLIIKNTETLSDVFSLPVAFLEPAKIETHVNNRTNDFNFNINIPKLKSGNNLVKKTILDISNYDTGLKLKIESEILGKNNITSFFNILSTAKDDQINTSIDFKNSHKTNVDSHIELLTSFSYSTAAGKISTEINLLNSNLKINNENWQLSNSRILIEDSAIEVDKFDIHSANFSQSLSINGKYSKMDPNSKLTVNLKEIDLQYIFETLAIDALQFGGHVSGNLNISSVMGKPYATTNITAKDFAFNNTELGILNLSSELDQETNNIILNGKITTKEKKDTYINGTINPIDQKLSIDFDADSINIGFLNKYTESILNEVSGRGSGKIRLHGNFSLVTVSGEANIINGKIGITLLESKYSFSDKVYLKDNLIYFNNIKFYDNKGNVAYGSGKISHDYFRDMMYYINFDANNFLVYNASEKTNPIFYGRVYGSGQAEIHGDEEELNIDIKMKTQKDTHVYMNFMDNEISSYSYIRFKEKNNTNNEETISKKDLLTPIQNVAGMNINMDIYIDATPDATFELLMDPVGGDVLKGSGTGGLQFVWNNKRAPELYGTFNVSKGSYNFTFQRLFEKKFFIQEGSTVQFRGDPFKALLDVTALYKITASLSDIDNNLVRYTGISSIPTNCILNITGQLQHPEIKLDIAFPTVGVDVSNQIKSYMDTEDMINKQVTYLLILSKFYTPEQSEVDNPSSDWTIMASATLSNQLTKIISQIDNRWQLGTHIRMSDTELTRTEVELILSSQLLDDRLIINGNFGYRDDPIIKKDAVITDIDVEFLLNKAGTWRFKAYNHFNEKFYYLNSDKGVQTQGVGIIFRKNFDKISELFRREKKQTKEVKGEAHHQTPINSDILPASEDTNFIKFKRKDGK